MSNYREIPALLTNREPFEGNSMSAGFGAIGSDMRSIWKYQLDIVRRQVVYMPEGALIVSVSVQNEYPVLYVEVNPEAKFGGRLFTIVTTGEKYDEDFAWYVGTAIIRDWYVAHILEGGVRVEGGNSKELDLREIASELPPLRIEGEVYAA